ncbi:MAG TPA: restriction endonuclease [Longimicrobium sp.]|nr:restriction endonuclease [Longimicrobium sp.]
MAEIGGYPRRVREMGWDGVARLWAAVRAGETPGWAAGRAFEHLVLRAFELDGAAVRWPFEVYLDGRIVEQIDGAVYAAGLSCLIEAKDTAEPLQVDAIAKLRSQLSRRPAGVLGLLFSRSGFTRPATTLARYLTPQNVLLWTGEDLEVALERRAMVDPLAAKYRRCVEEAVPHYAIRQVGP